MQQEKSMFDFALISRNFLVTAITVIIISIIFVIILQKVDSSLLGQDVQSFWCKVQDIQDSSCQAFEKIVVNDRARLMKDILVIKKDLAIIRNVAYTTLLQSLTQILVQSVSWVVLGITAYVGWRNFKIGEQNLKVAEANLKVNADKQETDRFSKAIEHLGNTDKDKINIRLGGIYVLGQIEKDSLGKYYRIIIDILSAFIRDKCLIDYSSIITDDENLSSKDSMVDKLQTDVCAAITVLARRKEYPGYDYRIDLRNVSLEKLELTELPNPANFKEIDFSGTKFNYATLWNVDFSRSNLSRTQFQGADLWKVNFTKTNLRNSHLSFMKMLVSANFTNANLTNAEIFNTELNNCNFSGADLRDVKISKFSINYRSINYIYASYLNISLDSAIFMNADFSNANLSNVNCRGVNFSGSNFNGANLSGADFTGANLTDAKNLNLDSAIFDDTTILPT